MLWFSGHQDSGLMTQIGRAGPNSRSPPINVHSAINEWNIPNFENDIYLKLVSSMNSISFSF